MTGRADYYAPGDHNSICYECGRKRKASELKHHWQGYDVCIEHWEARQPQDFVRALPDTKPLERVQPYPADVFNAGSDLLVLETFVADRYNSPIDFAILTEDLHPLVTET